MNRSEFHRLFKTPGPTVLPVIHVQDSPQITRNIKRCIAEGAQGVFLINHDFDVDTFIPLLRAARDAYPGLWIGVNFLAVTLHDAYPVLNELNATDCPIDAYWADDARIDERRRADDQPEAQKTQVVLEAGGWSGLYFGGTAFKKQRPVDPTDYPKAAAIAAEFMDVVTTSGIATGEAADGGKVEQFRRACGEGALALASGVTPDNAHLYAPDVDAFLVATGVSAPGEFYELDARLLAQVIDMCRRAGAA